MDFRDTPAEAAFRSDLRAWFRSDGSNGERWDLNVPADVVAARAWSSSLHDAGYAGLTWPVEYGGRGLDPTYQAIFYDEMVAERAPVHVGIIGLNMAGPTIIAWGTAQQKERFLAPLLAAQELWCQGFSEPGSGSDLAGAATRAVLDGDHWVINGQKVWSSHAHIADWCILLVRTDTTVPKHKGLSFLLVDMHSAGIEVRPLRQLTGEPEFNEIFFTDVRIPRESMLGQPGDGWDVAMTTLMHERGTLGFLFAAGLQSNLSRLVEFVAETAADGSTPAADPTVRIEVAREWVAVQALKFTNYRSLSRLLETGIPGPESSITKIAWAESNQRITTLATRLQGMAGGLADESAAWNGFWQQQQLRSRGNSIEGGTSEILRNIVAERVLNLPRGR
ncbi:acyl-CoA dehydrogenase family protein [Amycolatopsis sp.]|uniref:acyl-CoA dehydrogenase family protein n=1 Tax=Amycolatopsis sp. TaxID=37632 RepID=UPI0026130DE8|nr:acyl-CoA dehydrogenase family protein [Amycolatopsis sp.]